MGNAPATTIPAQPAATQAGTGTPIPPVADEPYCVPATRYCLSFPRRHLRVDVKVFCSGVRLLVGKLAQGRGEGRTMALQRLLVAGLVVKRMILPTTMENANPLEGEAAHGRVMVGAALAHLLVIAPRPG